MNILDPKFSLGEFTDWARVQPSNVQKQAISLLNVYKNISDKLASINRPDFENEKPHRFVDVPYVPNPKQDAFYKNCNDPRGRTRWLLGGNRSGKSETGCREDTAFCIGFRPWYPRSHPAFRAPFEGPVQGRIFCEDWEKAARGIIIPKLHQVIPNELIVKTKRNQTGAEYLWWIKVPFDATDATSLIELLTYNTDARSLEGWRGHFAHFDEPPPRSHYIATSRGLIDYNGYTWFTLTPLSEPWILDEVINNPNYVGDYTSIYDNLYDPLNGWGFLTSQGIEEFAGKLTDDEKKSRLHGEFAHLSGAIFKEFSRNTHVIPGTVITKEFKIPNRWWRTVFLDTAPRKPHMVVFVAWDEHGNGYAYDSFRLGDPSFHSGFDDLVVGWTIDDLIMEIDRRCNPFPQQFWCDPACQTPDLMSGRSLYDEIIKKFPFQPWPKVKDKKHAISALHKYLEVNPATGKPKFFIFQKCQRLIWELERYRWDEYRGVSKDKNDPKGTPVKKDDDGVDCLLAAAMLPPEPGSVQWDNSEPRNDWAQWGS